MCKDNTDKKNSSIKSVHSSGRNSGISSGATVAIVIVCIVLIIVIALGAWCFYAYTHPVTPSGLFLIEVI
jgi:cell division protein FtsN